MPEICRRKTGFWNFLENFIISFFWIFAQRWVLGMLNTWSSPIFEKSFFTAENAGNMPEMTVFADFHWTFGLHFFHTKTLMIPLFRSFVRSFVRPSVRPSFSIHSLARLFVSSFVRSYYHYQVGPISIWLVTFPFVMRHGCIKKSSRVYYKNPFLCVMRQGCRKRLYRQGYNSNSLEMINQINRSQWKSIKTNQPKKHVNVQLDSIVRSINSIVWSINSIEFDWFDQSVRLVSIEFYRLDKFSIDIPWKIPRIWTACFNFQATFTHSNNKVILFLL